jgi:uncharacterized protein (TIRG00374 family)
VITTLKYRKAQVKFTDVIKFMALLAIAVLLLVLAFRGISIRFIATQILKAKFFWVFLSFLCSALALVSRAIRWNLLIEPLGYKPMLRKTFYAVCIGYLANLAFPRLGEVTRCGSLAKAEAVPFHVLLGTVIVERVIDVLSLLICIIISTVIEFKRLGNFIQKNIFQPLLDKIQVLWSSPVMIIILAIVLMLIIFSIWYVVQKNKTSAASRFADLMNGIISGIRSAGRIKRPWLFIFHSVLIWFLYYLSVYAALYALPSTEGLGFSAALFLLVAGGLGMSAPVQGGIGVYHLLVSQGLVLYGLTQQDGLVFATLLHSLQVALILLFGSFSLLLLFLDNRKQKVLVDGIEKT